MLITIFLTDNWDISEPSSEAIFNILQWSTANPEDATERLMCGETPGVQEKQIPEVTNGESASCLESISACSERGYMGVRALCPMTCECHTPQLGKSGFLQASKWGCPASCRILTDLYMSHDPEPCVDQLLDNVNQDSEIWSKYVYGTADFLNHEVLSYFEYLLDLVHFYHEPLGFNWSEVEFVYTSIFHGYLWRSLADFQFVFAENISHPRNLTGCQFMASWELKAILGVDLCSADGHASLRTTCPVCCGCLIDRTGCWPTCSL